MFAQPSSVRVREKSAAQQSEEEVAGFGIAEGNGKLSWQACVPARVRETRVLICELPAESCFISFIYFFIFSSPAAASLSVSFAE